MLSDEMIQLLTAFVDGELSQRQREAVMRLLNQSSEARDMLKQLQENAHRLKSLPRHKVEPSLVDEVMQAIAEHKAQPKPVAMPTRRRRWWMPYLAASLAASLLVATVGIAFWKALNDDDNPNRNDPPVIVQNGKGEPKVEPNPEPPTPIPTPLPKKQPNPLLVDVSKMTDAIVRDFGAPVLVFTASFRDLKKDGKSTGDLVRELNREKSIQLDVTVQKNTQALERLAYVLKYHHPDVKLITDPSAKKPVDNKKAEYFVYAENLTTNELAKLVNELSDMYVVGTGNNQKNVQTPYQKVTVTPLAQEQKQTVAKLFGVEPAALERKDAKPEVKAERTIVLLPSAGGAQPSAEVRQFVNQRRGSQPGAVQVLIRIRQE